MLNHTIRIFFATALAGAGVVVAQDQPRPAPPPGPSRGGEAQRPPPRPPGEPQGFRRQGDERDGRDDWRRAERRDDRDRPDFREYHNFRERRDDGDRRDSREGWGPREQRGPGDARDDGGRRNPREGRDGPSNDFRERGPMRGPIFRQYERRLRFEERRQDGRPFDGPGDRFNGPRDFQRFHGPDGGRPGSFRGDGERRMGPPRFFDPRAGGRPEVDRREIDQGQRPPTRDGGEGFQRREEFRSEAMGPRGEFRRPEWGQSRGWGPRDGGQGGEAERGPMMRRSDDSPSRDRDQFRAPLQPRDERRGPDGPDGQRRDDRNRPYHPQPYVQ